MKRRRNVGEATVERQDSRRNDTAATRSLPELVRRDPFMEPFVETIQRRMEHLTQVERRITGGRLQLADFASGHEYFGLHPAGRDWVFREWAPNASEIRLLGSYCDWQADKSRHLERLAAGDGVWEVHIPGELLRHGDHYKLLVKWPGGEGERLPSYARRTVQDPRTHIFSAQVWQPEQEYQWRCSGFRRPDVAPLIYEAHIGMAQEEEKVGTYREFRERILPRIVDAGYNVLQLMAIQEHPYYGSFGYHVSSFFAASSRFGTPEELKELVDAAHEAGVAVIMDLVHSHAVRNENEGLGRFDGTLFQYFHDGPRGFHRAWDSRCFNYAKPEVLHFLLSNCRFWLDEYRFDGFRFDGVTSMMYREHGLEKNFLSYHDYYNGDIDEDALAYLGLANRLIHTLRPDAITIAEDVSGMPGVAAPLAHGGSGFDYRLAMGLPDFWIKTVKHVADEGWHVAGIFHECTNRRADEKTISYAESHDQALVGDQTLIFRLIGPEMYWHMNVFDSNLVVERGMALHKLIRICTLTTAGGGYLNFMGNEFGHPEWIDFPREGNHWSYHYARRQWHLRYDMNLRYRFLAEFDQAMIKLVRRGDLLQSSTPRMIYEHVADQVLVFQRGGWLFLFNFNPVESFADREIPAAPGKYKLVLDSDADAFGGHARVAPGQEFLTSVVLKENQPENRLRVYLPSRTVLVLEKID